MIFDRPGIPNHWTGEQAIQVVDFLEELINNILWVHGEKMCRAAQVLNDEPPDPEEEMLDDSDIPY
jgi:hypothetical protein